jgi:hypothetical protein
MPYFDQNPLEQLALQAGTADARLDLRGLDQADALGRIDELLVNGDHSRTWLVCFDPPASDGKETLFLPVGKRLLAARREGRLSSCLPASDGTGYVIAFAD